MTDKTTIVLKQKETDREETDMGSGNMLTDAVKIIGVDKEFQVSPTKVWVREVGDDWFHKQKTGVNRS